MKVIKKQGLNPSINGKIGASPSLPTEKEKKLITLRGTTTSQIRKRERLSDTPAYCFLKTDSQAEDIPTIFRTQESYQQIKAKIKKHSYLEVQGTFANSKESNRSSFTAYSYQLLSHDK
jgi:hypothetical protein